jgi:uncharacterized protein (DUF1697 family)
MVELVETMVTADGSQLTAGGLQPWRAEMSTVPAKSLRYVGLLRGVNVGGHKPVKMAELGATFTGLRLKNVRTVLASGNVLFDAPPSSRKRLAARITAGLKRAFGFDVTVVLRTLEEIGRLLDSNPFGNMQAPARAQLYITFLAEDAPAEVAQPDRSPRGNIRMVRVSAGEIASVVVLSPGHGTTDLMSTLDRQFGRMATTRNWNTVKRIRTAHSSRERQPK